MKETGIIMSGNHPKLILDLIKTLTRRTYGLDEINKDPDKWIYKGFKGGYADFSPKVQESYHSGLTYHINCPYGQVGDRLWVREKFYFRVGSPDAVIYFDGTEKFRTGEIIENFANVDKLRWQPSIHMFKEFSRITLEITEEKAARTLDLTPAEAIAEGYTSIEEANREFLRLAHLPEDSNIWNWVIGFKLLKK